MSEQWWKRHWILADNGMSQKVTSARLHNYIARSNVVCFGAEHCQYTTIRRNWYSSQLDKTVKMSRHLQLAQSSRIYDRQGVRFSQHDSVRPRPHGTDYGYSPPRRMLAAVKEGMMHPKPPSYRQMDRDSSLCKLPIEHCRNSTSRSAGEYWPNYIIRHVHNFKL